MKDRRRRSIRPAVALVAVLIAGASCSDEAASPPVPVTATTVTATSKAAVPTTTTTAPPTSTTEDPEVAAVRAAHLAYLAMFELVGDPPDPDHPELALRATGDAYERLRANLAQDKLAGNRLVGGYHSSIREITVTGDGATVVDCSLDTGVVYDGDGAVLVPADTERSLRTVRLEKQAGVWKVWRLEVPNPPLPCDA